MTQQLNRVTVAALMALTLGVSATASHARIAWTRDINSARVQAQKTGKPIFIDFYTDWCGWCKKLDSNVYTNRGVQSLSRNFIMVKLNAEAEGAAYAQHYRVSGFPTMVFLNSQSQYLGTIPGYVDSGTMKQYMQSALSTAKRTAKASKALKESRSPQLQRFNSALTRKQPADITSMTGNSGIFLLDDKGVVRLDKPTTKKKTPAKRN